MGAQVNKPGRPTAPAPVTQAAIADAMNCSVRLVQKLEQRALRKIRLAIEDAAKTDSALRAWLTGEAE